MAFNRVILMGNLAHTPELKQTQSGKLVVSCSVAVQRPKKQGQDSGADFFNFTAWDKTAELISKYFVKGQAILICGRLTQRKWTGNDGNPKYAVEVIADEISFVGRKDENGSQGYSPDISGAASVQPNFTEVPADDDLPF